MQTFCDNRKAKPRDIPGFRESSTLYEPSSENSSDDSDDHEDLSFGLVLTVM
jgi:hypothetical protein